MQSECVYGVDIAPLARFDPQPVANSFFDGSFPFHCLFSADLGPPLKQLLDGNIRPGTLGALSIELLARISQVGIEPTTSRLPGEVTLSYTTSNLVISPQHFRCEQTL